MFIPKKMSVPFETTSDIKTADVLRRSKQDECCGSQIASDKSCSAPSKFSFIIGDDGRVFNAPITTFDGQPVDNFYNSTRMVATEIVTKSGTPLTTYKARP